MRIGRTAGELAWRATKEAIPKALGFAKDVATKTFARIADAARAGGNTASCIGRTIQHNASRVFGTARLADNAPSGWKSWLPTWCFVAGTLIATADGGQSIEQVRPGDRVLTYEQQASATEVDPDTWRKITLRLPNPDCPEDVVDLQLLRSPEWMESVGCAEGAQIWFDLDEMAIHGPALVTAVEACPPLAPGTGRVVLATVTHFNTCVLDVRLVGQAETLSPTSNHPLYSATRHDWVRAGSLTAGEQLVTREGIVTVESITPRSGAYRVYNLEVEGEHAYYAGAAQVLSHNNCANGGGRGKKYVTYTAPDLSNPGKTYVGRSSGPRGLPVQEILDKRAAGHHRNLGPLEIDQVSTNRAAIRGREQIVKERLQTDGIGTDQINGVSPRNPNGTHYREQAEKEFGNL